ncbi:MAG: hypothetical protein AB7P97_21995 [Hyphomonadaceae bacterium]
MTAQNTTADTAPKARDWFRITVYASQTFFGAWFLIHGLNHWVHFFPQPPGSDSLTSRLIRAMIETGLFDLIKGAEVVSGVLLLMHRFVPLAIVMAIPAGVVIAYINLFLNRGIDSFIVGFLILAILLIMGVGYIKSFAPMLRYKVEEPSRESINELRKLVGGWFM